MKGIGFILVVLGIIVLVAIYNDGFEGFKANPLESTVDSTKKIIETGKDAVGFIKDNTGNTTADLVEVGKLPCATNEDCDLLEACGNSSCVCYDNGACYK